MFEKIGGRKTVMALICLVAGAAIDLTTDRGLSENLMILMLSIVGLYTTGNVASKIAAARPKGGAGSGAPSTELANKLAEIDTAQKQAEAFLSGMYGELEKTQKTVEAINKRTKL